MGHSEEESGARTLMLNLLSSPDNLQFALKHQADKVESIKKRIETFRPPTRPEENSVQPQHSIQGSIPAKNTAPFLTSERVSSASVFRSSHVTARVRRKWQRTKARVKQPYIQLPPSFKYPDPIDVCPTRSARQQSKDRKKSTGGTKPQAISSIVPHAGHLASQDHITPRVSQTLDLCYQSTHGPVIPQSTSTEPQPPPPPAALLGNLLPTSSDIANAEHTKLVLSVPTLASTISGKAPMLEIVVGDQLAGDGLTSGMQPASLLQNPWQHHHHTLTPFLQWRNAVEYTKSRRMRTKIEPDMLDLLESKYSESHFVSPAERRQLADSLGITERAVIYWYQNRRRKDIKNLNNKGSP